MNDATPKKQVPARKTEVAIAYARHRLELELVLRLELELVLRLVELVQLVHRHLPRSHMDRYIYRALDIFENQLEFGFFWLYHATTFPQFYVWSHSALESYSNWAAVSS